MRTIRDGELRTATSTFTQAPELWPSQQIMLTWVLMPSDVGLTHYGQLPKVLHPSLTTSPTPTTDPHSALTLSTYLFVRISQSSIPFSTLPRSFLFYPTRSMLSWHNYLRFGFPRWLNPIFPSLSLIPLTLTVPTPYYLFSHYTHLSIHHITPPHTTHISPYTILPLPHYTRLSLHHIIPFHTNTSLPTPYYLSSH